MKWPLDRRSDIVGTSLLGYLVKCFPHIGRPNTRPLQHRVALAQQSQTCVVEAGNADAPRPVGERPSELAQNSRPGQRPCHGRSRPFARWPCTGCSWACTRLTPESAWVQLRSAFLGSTSMMVCQRQRYRRQWRTEGFVSMMAVIASHCSGRLV